MTPELSDAQYEIYVRAYGKQNQISPDDARACWRAGMQAVLASLASAPTVPVAPHGPRVSDFEFARDDKVEIPGNPEYTRFLGLP